MIQIFIYAMVVAAILTILAIIGFVMYVISTLLNFVLMGVGIIFAVVLLSMVWVSNKKVSK
jgi:hypothetical protein